ncbi:hypothetical protein TNCV_2142891 [Trichonephila clavipes]|nr:hypothetical protein TNCV_2142891 [Trichonephila clavipes]
MQEDETIFYRFCKARDYDLEEAEIMLRKSTDEGVLVCQRIVSTSDLPKASHTFSMGFRSGERAGHTRR